MKYVEIQLKGAKTASHLRSRHAVEESEAEIVEKILANGTSKFIGFTDANGKKHFWSLDEIREVHIIPDDPTAVDASEL